MANITQDIRFRLSLINYTTRYDIFNAGYILHSSNPIGYNDIIFIILLKGEKVMRKIKAKTLVVLIVIIVSLLLLFINEHFMKTDAVFYNLILTVAVTLLTTAIISWLSDKFLDNSVNEIASTNFSVLKCCQEYGLIGIYDNFPLDIPQIKDGFFQSKRVYVVMNDAKAFISSNMPLIENRIKNTKGETVFILQDYNCSDIMSALTRKNGHLENKNYYKEKIKNVIEYHLKKLRNINPKKHAVKVYLNSNYNTLAMILTDTYAMISVYRVSSGKTGVPHFVFSHKGDEYQKISDDIEKILDSSEEFPLD